MGAGCNRQKDLSAIGHGRNSSVRAPVLPDGNIYLLVDVTLENIGDETEFVSSRMLMNLFDSNGQTQQWTQFPDSRGTIDGKIPPGQERQGELVWEVREGSVGLKLVFDKTAFSIGAIKKVEPASFFSLPHPIFDSCARHFWQSLG